MEVNSSAPVELHSSTTSAVVELVQTTEENKKMNGGIHLQNDYQTYQLSEFLGRERLVNSLTISPGANQHIQTFRLGYGWCILPTVTSVLNQYTYFKGKPRVCVKITGSAAYQGYVKCSFYPVEDLDGYNNSISVYVNNLPLSPLTYLSQMPSLDMNLSETGCKTISLPYPSPRAYLSASAYDDYYCAVYLKQYITTQAGVTPPDLKLDIYVSYHDVEMYGLVPQGDGKVEKFLGFSSEILSRINLPYANVASEVASLGSRFAGMLGWSRPPVEATTCVISRHHGNMALMSGQPDMVIHCGSNPEVQSNVSSVQYPLSDGKDTNIDACLKRWSFVRDITVNTGALSIHPTILDTEPTTPYSPVSITSLGFYASMFRFWRGTINIKLKIYTSPLVRWKIALVIVPGVVEPPASYTGDASYLSHVIDVVGTTEVDLEVPYFVPSVWTDVVPFVVSTQQGMGSRIRLYSLTPPTGLTDVGTFPLVEMYMCAGKDFELAVPDLTIANKYAPQLGVYIPQGAQCAYSFGEDFDDFRVLTKRSCLVAVSLGDGPSFIPADGFTPLPELDPISVGAGTFGTFNWSFATWLRLAYHGYNGSSVWRGETSNTGGVPGTNSNWVYDAGSVTPGIRTTDATDVSRTSSGLAWADGSKFEVSVPSRNTTIFKLCNLTDVASTATIPKINCLAIVNAFEFPTGDWNITKISLFHAGGDDYTVGGFVAAPPLYLRA